MKYYGEDGVAAYGTIMYINFLFTSVFIGYSIGSSPIVGYNYGSKNYKELQNIFRKSLLTLFVFSGIITVASVFLAGPISTMRLSIFTTGTEMLCLLTLRKEQFWLIRMYSSCVISAL